MLYTQEQYYTIPGDIYSKILKINLIIIHNDYYIKRYDYKYILNIGYILKINGILNLTRFKYICIL